MSKIADIFQLLWDNYPDTSADQVKQAIGGHVNAAWITNTCTIRLSRAFNAAGDDIPGPTAAQKYGMNVVSGDDKKWYAYRVKEFHAFMQAKYGVPTTFAGNGGAPLGLNKKRGVIEFVVAFTDATGHFDMWNGSACKYEQFFPRAKLIHLWA